MMKNDNKDMNAFISRLVSGDRTTWDEFVERFSKLIYKIFNNPGFRFTRDQIDDLFEDFFLEILKKNYRKIRLYEGRNNCKFPSYLRTIATRMAIDRRKELDKKKMMSLHGPVDEQGKYELVDLIPAGCDEPMKQLIDEEERRQLKWTIFNLDSLKCLVTILVTYHKSMKRERLAELLSTSRQNVDVIYKRAKDKVKQMAVKAGAAVNQERETLEWDDDVLVQRDHIAVQDPSMLMDRAVRELDVPDELLIGLLFINAPILEPTPNKLAMLFKSDPDSVIVKVRSVLQKLTKI